MRVLKALIVGMLQLSKVEKRVNKGKLLAGNPGALNCSYQNAKSCESLRPHLPLGIAIKGGQDEIQVSQGFAIK